MNKPFDIYPAIDIRGGQAVRLSQGDFSREIKYYKNPLEASRHWIESGAKWLHVIDLDGARSGSPVNTDIISQIVRSKQVKIQVGGGFRCMNDIEQAIESGVDRVILGTAAIRDQGLLKIACKEFPGRIAVGIDARAGIVAVNGWEHASDTSTALLGKLASDSGASAIIYTDIERDGMLSGPNYIETRKLASSVNIPVIASGGVSSIDDIQKLTSSGSAGVVVGRALYTGDVDLKEAITIAEASLEC
tara:strand:+ start:2252 stop:2992 length:741 start_codon:yes stop_codon:yes gene_type:complete